MFAEELKRRLLAPTLTRAQIEEVGRAIAW